ncbi:putative retroelement [Abeliophyllum distichum]|uniref:Retroelement n=1 Tax=Abeliophyllum distichum TaxID=126358 RepID=A0ABD1U2M7_9LAMI
MPYKNSDKEPANQRVVQSVTERYEEQQNTPGTEGQNQSRYEPMTELSPRTMCTLLGELTQDVVGQTEVRLAELVKGNAYACPLVVNSGISIKNEPMRDENKKARVFSFDVAKADTIFDRLYKDKQIKLSNKHKLPNPEQIKDKKYCKWHIAWSHTTNNCLVFRHVLQDAIESGRITFEAKKKMAVDDNPFPRPLRINMITTGFKSGLPKFKLVVDNGKEDPELHPSVFERLKGKEGKRYE